MIIKRRTRPRILEKYEALQARLPANSPHHREISREITRTIRGYEGELIVDGHLKTLAPQATIIQDLTLKTNGQIFQMDNLLITPRTLYIIEVKNFSRAIYFDTNLNQFSSGDGDQLTGYRHPITQARMHKFKLENWLVEHNQPNIPVRYFVAISNPRTIINVVGDTEEISKVVLHGEHLPWKILEQENKINSHTSFNHQKLGYYLINNESEFDKDVLKEYAILPEQLLPGVRCRHCNSLGMQQDKWSWVCSNCKANDRLAGNRGINEYMALVRPWVTNKEIVKFLGIDSRYVVSRLLKNHPNLRYYKQKRRWIRK